MLTSVAEALNVPRESLDPTAPFTSYGLDSIAAFTLTVGLAEWLDRDLPASLFWEFSTIAELADHLAEMNELTSP
jgi:acyl carrier protein